MVLGFWTIGGILHIAYLPHLPHLLLLDSVGTHVMMKMSKHDI